MTIETLLALMIGGATTIAVLSMLYEMRWRKKVERRLDDLETLLKVEIEVEDED